MTAITANQTNSDPLGHEAFIEAELAISAMSAMIGHNIASIAVEKGKDSPDTELIAKLKEENKIYTAEQNEVYSGNREVRRAVIEKYSPIIKARFENA